MSEWLPKSEYTWETREFVKAASARKDGKQNKGEELLIMNYKIEEEKGKENKLIGEFFDND